jgi:hypothetical protein
LDKVFFERLWRSVKHEEIYPFDYPALSSSARIRAGRSLKTGQNRGKLEADSNRQAISPAEGTENIPL